MRASIAVENALIRNPKARDSDKVLFLEVWEMMGFYLSDIQKAKFMNLPSTETIHRIRRKLQQQGKWEASSNVSNSRRLKSLIVQQNMPKASINTAERVLEEVPVLRQAKLI